MGSRERPNFPLITARNVVFVCAVRHDRPLSLRGSSGNGALARAVGDLDALVAISQMTVSQMDALSMSESHHQRLHWLSEQVLNWSGLPVVHVRPTVFLDSPLFTTLAARSIGDSGTILLPFGTGRTSPVTTDDVARVVATILTDPGPYSAGSSS
jgi:uncharacterized protein YbjT (DUF2867 family)